MFEIGKYYIADMNYTKPYIVWPYHIIDSKNLRRNRYIEKPEQTTVQISKPRMNGLRYQAILDGDFYASITLDKLLVKAGILGLEDSELERLLKKQGIREENIVAK